MIALYLNYVYQFYLQKVDHAGNLSDDSRTRKDYLGDGGDLLDNLDGSLESLANLEFLVGVRGKRESGGACVHFKEWL